MPDDANRAETRLLDINVGRNIKATVSRCTYGDFVDPDSGYGDIKENLDLDTEQENIETLINLVGVVNAIYQRAGTSRSMAGLESTLREPLNALIKVLGRKLYSVLFRGELHEVLRKELQPGRGMLRVRLVFDRSRQELERWPWEYLFIPRESDYMLSDRFLALITMLTLNRRIVTRSQDKLHVTGPINKLLIVSRPPQDDLPEMDGGRVRAAITKHFPGGIFDHELSERSRDEFERDGARVTYDAFVSKLNADNWHIVHLMAHGRLSEDGHGELAFSKSDGTADWIAGDEIARKVADYRQRAGSLKLVFLHACESALPGPFVGLSSVAQQLARVGVPAVIGMQGEIKLGIADVFAEEFYQTIAARNSIDIGVKQGREKIARVYRDRYDQQAFGLPVLYLSSYTTLAPETAAGVDTQKPVPQTPRPERRGFDETVCPRCGQKGTRLVCGRCGFMLRCPGCETAIIDVEYNYCDRCHPPRRLEHAPWQKISVDAG